MDCPYPAWFEYEATNQELRELFQVAFNEEDAAEQHLRDLQLSKVNDLGDDMPKATRRSIVIRRERMIESTQFRAWGLKRSLEALLETRETLDEEAEKARDNGHRPDSVRPTALRREYEAMSYTERQLRVMALLEEEIKKIQEVGRLSFDEAQPGA